MGIRVSLELIMSTLIVNLGFEMIDELQQQQ